MNKKQQNAIEGMAKTLRRSLTFIIDAQNRISVLEKDIKNSKAEVNNVLTCLDNFDVLENE